MTRRQGRHPVRDRRGALAGAVLIVGALALTPVPAVAQEPLPDDNSGTDQYIEPVPDAGGDRQAGGGSDRRPNRLPEGTRDSLPPGDEGRILGRIATDPGAGAPAGNSASGGGESGGSGGSGSGDDKQNGKDGPGAGRVPPADDSGTGVFSALTSAVADSESPAIPLLLIAIAGMALAAALVRFRRRS